MAYNNYQSVVDEDQTGSTATISAYAVGAESDRILVVHTSHVTSVDSYTHSVTWDGNAMTEAVTREDLNSGIYHRSSLFEYLNPANTTGDIVLTISASGVPDGIGVQAVYLDGMSGTVEATGEAEDLTEPHNVTVTGITSGADVLAGIAGEASSGDITAWTPEAGTTLIGQIEIDSTFSDHAGFGYISASGTSETPGFESSATTLLAATLTGAAWAPAAGGGGGGSVVVTALSDIQ